MTGQKKHDAMLHMVNGLHEYGYIDDKEKRMLLYRLEAGDTAVLYEIRNYLIKIADEITK